jgi:O-antigen ligase
MTSLASDPTRLLYRILCLGSLLGVAILTLIDRGATRAYSTPWIFILWWVQLAPLIALSLRLRPSSVPLRLPSREWTIFGGAVIIVVAGSALVSPYRGPSLFASLTPLAAVAGFFLLHDAAGQPMSPNSRRAALPASLIKWAGIFGVALVAVSLGHWLISLARADLLRHPARWLDYRNDHPLGHSNYTAGLSLLVIPWFGYLAWRSERGARVGWIAMTALGLIMLFTSGSRGGLIGAAVLTVVSIFYARVNRKVLILLCLTAIAAAVAFGYAHPRTRALIFNSRGMYSEPNQSNVQRSAMATAGWRMGEQRPLFGWGAGSTPLAYPKFRAGLDGGVENALQLHSAPVQIWADFGVPGALLLLTFIVLVWRERRPDAVSVSQPERPFARVSIVTLAGYSAFALTDAQLDVPIFAGAMAALAALIARPASAPNARWSRGTAALAVLTLALVAAWGRGDAAPELNLRALELGRDPKRLLDARRLFEQSLALNPDQEIAHFNLGWLLVTADPKSAETHFIAAARLVPDKGGVYFGLALSRLNQDRPELVPAVVHALALECLNDPSFLISPWWRQPYFATLRPAVIKELHVISAYVADAFVKTKDRRARDAAYIPVLADWFDHASSPGEILRQAFTPARVSYFAARPVVPNWEKAPIRSYHRERPGYPVLIRDSDLPTPVDLFEVQENGLVSGDLAPLFPAKGWLPAPLLVELQR